MKIRIVVIRGIVAADERQLTRIRPDQIKGTPEREITTYRVFAADQTRTEIMRRHNHNMQANCCGSTLIDADRTELRIWNLTWRPTKKGSKTASL
jgi:hypothetical protein